MKKINQISLVLALSVAVLSCSSNNENTDFLPVEKPEITNQLSTDLLWSSSVGDGVEDYFSRLKPTIAYDTLFAADRTGKIKAFEPKTGKTLWQTDIRASETSYWRFLGLNFSPSVRVSGLVASYEKLFVGCENGEMVALDVKTGEEIWRTKVVGEIISPAIAEEGKVIFNLGNGDTIALDAENGEQVWQAVGDVPSLTLRGGSTPAYAQGGVFVGSATGKIITYAAATGQLAWDVSVAKAQGSTELARIVDIDSTPLFVGANLYAISAGGALVSVDVRTGRVIWKREYRGYENLTTTGNELLLSDDHSHLYLLDAKTGIEKWSSLVLRNRQVSAGVIWGKHFIVGDFEGYVYFFDVDTGELKHIKSISSESLLAQPIVHDDILYFQTREGEIFAMAYNDIDK